MDNIITQYEAKDGSIKYHRKVSPPGPKSTAGYFERHNQFEVLYLIEGDLEYLVEGELYRVNPGDLILVNTDEIHKLTIARDKPYERIVFMFNLSAMSNLFASEISAFSSLLFNDYRPSRIIPAAVAEKYRIAEQLKQICDAPQDDKYFFDTLSARTLLLAADLNRILNDKDAGGIKPVQINEFIKKTINYINQHLTEELSLEKLAQELYVSESYLSHAFKQRMNISVNNFIITKKIHYANKLIASGVSPSEAALKTGYNYYTTFFYNFKSVMGKTPSEVARKNN